MRKLAVLGLVAVFVFSGVVMVAQGQTTDDKTIPARTLVDNDAIDDITLIDFDFEDYEVGDDPSSTVPEIFRRTTADTHNSTFTVAAAGAGQELHIYKYAASTLAPAWAMAAPSGYVNHSMTWDFSFNGDEDQSRGFLFSAYGGSDSYSYIAIQVKITAFPASTFSFRLYNTSSTAFAIPISEDVRYYVTINVYGATFTYDLYLRTAAGTIVGQAVGFPFYTYNTRHASGITTYSWGAVETETEGNFYLDNIEITADANRVDMYPAYNATSSFTFQFDGAHEGVYDLAYPYLSSIGYNAVVPVTIDFIGDAGNMTWGELQTLSDAGWELAGHGVTHSSITGLAYDAACAEISNTKAYIEANVTGCTVTTFTAPNNAWNVTLEMYAQSVGYTSTPYSYSRHYYGPTFPATVNTRLNWTSMGVGYNVVWWAHNVSAGAPRNSDDIYISELMDLVNLTKEYGFSNWVTNNEAYLYSTDREIFDPTVSTLTVSDIDFVSNIARPISVLIRADEGDAWQNGYWVTYIDGSQQSYVNVTYPTYESQFVNIDDYGSVSFQRLLTVCPVSSSWVNVTQWDATSDTILMTWYAENATEYTVYCSAEYGYKVYLNGVVITTGTGPSITFSTSLSGEFEVVVWNEKTITTLVVLTINMIGLGIMVSVVVGWVFPFSKSIAKGKFKNPKEMMNEVIRGAVFIVVGLSMYVFLYHVAIG